MKAKMPLIARILLGLVFVVFGIMGLFQLGPQPTGLPEKLVTFNTGLMASGYFMPFLKVVEIICGLLLLLGMYVPLALVVLAPIVINIFLVHAFLHQAGLVIAIPVGALLFYLSFFAQPYSLVIKQLFKK